MLQGRRKNNSNGTPFISCVLRSLEGARGEGVAGLNPKDDVLGCLNDIHPGHILEGNNNVCASQRVHFKGLSMSQIQAV